ncbi:hypothetical protein [Variovorax sp. JS1663]|uniref:hypothetical protein n=1 Tax=Variovorax sp. JS1663 TaxID=1851577 RepID=UPI0011811363|nr:hypothetical protein [Variovorax sp. JS1663]
MKQQKLVLIASVLLVAVWAGVFAYGDIADPHELTQPVTITSTRAGADGGSMAVQVRGANGKKLTVERVGSLEVERSLQKMYVVNDVFGVIPLRRAAGKNSQLEKETREMLESLLRGALPLTQRELLNRNDQEALRTVPGNVLAVYDLATWIGERR